MGSEYRYNNVVSSIDVSLNHTCVKVVTCVYFRDNLPYRSYTHSLQKVFWPQRERSGHTATIVSPSGHWTSIVLGNP